MPDGTPCNLVSFSPNRVNSMSSHHIFFSFFFSFIVFLFFLLYLYEEMDVSQTSFGNHFSVYKNQAIILYVLNLYRGIFLNYFKSIISQ